MSILGTGGLVFLREEDGEPNVNNEADQQADAGNPNTHAMKEGMEEMGVFVKGLFTGEDEEVSQEVACQEKDEG